MLSSSKDWFITPPLCVSAAQESIRALPPGLGKRRDEATVSIEIVRAVREQKAQYVITYQGQLVGVLSPIDEEQPDALLVQAVQRPTDEELMAELDELSQRIARRWLAPTADCQPCPRWSPSPGPACQVHPPLA